MKRFLGAIRSHWRRSDTLLFASNLVAFFAYWGNCYWESLAVTYAAALLPLAIQGVGARNDRVLRDALLFGFIVGASWPLGEWVVVTNLVWWGNYLAGGPYILETPVYCCLIGWLASTYCYYIGARYHEIFNSVRLWAVVSGLSALIIGFLGENFFVAARMWEYFPSPLDWFQVPAFVPIAYGIGYGAIPLLRNKSIPVMTFVFLVILLVVSVGLGLLTGFFPRV